MIYKNFLCFLLVYSLFFNASLNAFFFGTDEVSWGQLRSYSIYNQKTERNLEKYIGEKIKIPGYAVPIEGDSGFEFVSEFLLVPVKGMCIHVPPPPPNQVIFVKMKKPVPFELLYDAIWLFGIFNIGKYEVGGEMIYETEAMYEIIGDKVEIYDIGSSKYDNRRK